MYIFIDEAGGFQVTSRPNQVSCVAALLVPESLLVRLFRRFRGVVRPWRVSGEELKGSQLGEHQMAQVIGAVRRYDVILLSVAIDMGLHTEAGIRLHKQRQVEKIRAALAPTMGQELRAWIEELAARMEKLSSQLYVQAALLVSLVQSVIEAGTLYYAQRIPKTLGSFSWRLDAKDVVPTNYEELWRKVVGPLLQTRSLSSPLTQMIGANYSAFEKFCGEAAEAPAYLRPRVTDPGGPFQYVDTNALLADLRFCPSHRQTGIQIVDMLGSAIRRACNGTLKPAGWEGLGRLMPAPAKGTNCVRLVALEEVSGEQLPYAAVLLKWDRDTRRMIV